MIQQTCSAVRRSARNLNAYTNIYTLHVYGKRQVSTQLMTKDGSYILR